MRASGQDDPRRNIAALTPEQRELLALRLRNAQAARTDDPATQRRSESALPLSFTQEQLWFLDRLDPGTPVYNVPFALRLTGPLDAGALHAAIQAVVARQEALRIIVSEGADGLRQVVRARVELPLPVEDLRPLP